MITLVEALIERLSARRSGGGWAAKCPAHDDRQPSLSIDTGADGRVLLHCHAGCDIGSILSALDLKSRDLFPATARLSADSVPPSSRRQASTPVTPTPISEFADEFLSTQQCHLAIAMAETLRYAPDLCERIARMRGWKGETIRTLTCEPSLGWHKERLAFIYETGVKLRWRQHGERIVRWAFGRPWLWRGSYIDRARTIYLCEGETDAISLIDAGLEACGQMLAVALPSASTFNERWATLFAGKDVVLAFDADNAGREATRRVSRFLHPYVASLKQLNWKGLQRAS